MKKIKLDKLKLTNFKAIKDFEINLNQITNIEGANASGKTTIFDAYNWLLFGKNSQNQSVFEIKTTNENGDVLHNLDHSVEGCFIVDESELILKRVYKEKWTKKKGAEVSELTGHVTSFFKNEVPITLIEYKEVVDSLINEDKFKILNNPLYFNNNIDWGSRRVILSSLAGEITDIEILSSLCKSNADVIEELQSSEKTLAEYDKEFKAKRKLVKAQLLTIPSRIDEANLTMVKALDWKALEDSIILNDNEIERLEKLSNNVLNQQEVKITEIAKLNRSKFLLEEKLTIAKNKSKSLSNNGKVDLLMDLDQLNISSKSNVNKIDFINEQIKDREENIIKYNEAIEKLTKERSEFVANFEDISKTVYLDSITNADLSCPTCYREFEPDKIDEIRLNAKNKFETNKTNELNVIQNEGKSKNFKAKIEGYKIKVDEFKTELEGFKAELKTKLAIKKDEDSNVESKKLEIENFKPSQVVESAEEVELKKEIAKIIIPELSIENGNAIDYKSTIDNIKIENEALKNTLQGKSTNEKQTARIEELNATQLKLSQEIANFEKSEIAIEKFNQSRMKMIEERVNFKFKLVKFKMFEQQLNEGTKEICECMVDGVKFNDLNTASRINAGLDIINVLSGFYEVNVPVFIDNRESISNIIEVKSQLVNLVVNDDEKNLKIS